MRINPWPVPAPCWEVLHAATRGLMSGERILVVDDERHIVELAQMYLEQAGYCVGSARDGQEALASIRLVRPALVVLDLMLPGLDGWEVCRRLRAESDIPIIMLTARSDDVDRIVGLELGADDYVTKPFNPRELVARVAAVLRRTHPASRHPEGAVAAGQLVISPSSREAQLGERLLVLRPKEFDLLLCLAEHRGLVMSRNQLLDLVWGYDFPGGTRTVDAHISHLRAHLRGSDVRIETHRGIGYKLVV
jgi:DNA-binding response OmpR family regulator